MKNLCFMYLQRIDQILYNKPQRNKLEIIEPGQ